MILQNTSNNAIAYGKIDAYKARAKLYAKMNKYNEAIADLTECINISNDDSLKAKAYTQRGNFYNWTLKMSEKANADYSMAIDLYTKVISKNNAPEKIVSYYSKRANLYEILQQYDKALADYTKGIEMDPRNYVLYNFRGGLYKKLKCYKEAIADYSKSIEIKPGEMNYSSYGYLGGLYKELKQYDKAIADYSKTIELNPNNESFYYYRGGAYGNLGKFDKAIEYFNKAIELNPNNAKLYARCSEAYFKLGNYNKALENCSNAIQINSNNLIFNSDIYRCRGLAYYYLEKYEEAIFDFNYIIEISKSIHYDPNDYAIYYHLRGMCY